MSGFGAWLAIIVVVLVLNRILSAAAGPARPGAGPVAGQEGRDAARGPGSGPPGSGDRRQAALDLLRTVDTVLGGRSEPARRRPADPGADAVQGHGLGSEIGNRSAGGRAGKGRPASRRSSGVASAGLPELAGRSRLQRAVLYAEVLGPPVSLARDRAALPGAGRDAGGP